PVHAVLEFGEGGTLLAGMTAQAMVVAVYGKVHHAAAVESDAVEHRISQPTHVHAADVVKPLIGGPRHVRRGRKVGGVEGAGMDVGQAIGSDVCVHCREGGSARLRDDGGVHCGILAGSHVDEPVHHIQDGAIDNSPVRPTAAHHRG